MSGARGTRSRSANGFDIERLEAAVIGLVETCQQLRAENVELRERADGSEVALAAARTEIEEQRTRREVVIKRIDDLVTRLDLLDGRTASELPRGSTRAEG